MLANGAGSEIVFTLIFAATADATTVDAQIAVVEAELETVREMCEAPHGRLSLRARAGAARRWSLCR